MFKIELTQADLDKCVEFGKAQLPTSSSHYAKRGQTNEDKILKDIVTGKMGEIGIHRLLVQANSFVSQPPDFTIYKGRKKSWACDIIAGSHTGTDQLKLHCKTQSAESLNRYGLSWIFQYGGNGHGHTDKFFKELDDPTSYFIGASLDGLWVTVHCAIAARDIVSNDLIKMPA